MNEGIPSTLVIGDRQAAVPGSRVRLSIGQKLAIFFVSFLAATYVNTHLAVKLFDSLGSSAHIVNETGRLRYLSQKIAYLATRENGDERNAVVVQIDTYNRILADIKAYLQGDGRILLENNPQLTDMLAGLTARWQGYAGTVVTLVTLVNSDLDARRRQQAFSRLHDSAEEMLVSANAIVDALAKTDAEVRHQVHRKLDGALLLESLFLLIVFLLAQYRVSRPLRQLNTLCHNFAAGEHSARMHFSSSDEVGELSRSFNRTAEITAALIRNLNERTREATLLHRVATTLQENIAVDTAIERVVKLLPEGWQYPEIAIACISHGNIRHQSPDFKETSWRIEAAVDCHDGTPLRVAVAYREARPAAAEGPFLAEERQMLDDVAGMLKSFTDRKRIADELIQMATLDSLTGLPNRNLLKDRIDQALLLARRQQRQVTVIFIDLDRFKNVNDTLGHDIGDHLLTVVAHRLRGCLREGDTVARIGGDEFVVVLPDVGEEGVWRGVAEKILAALRVPCLINAHELYVTGSLGISVYPRDGDDCQTLLKHADIAMYRAKEEGHNDYRHYTQDMDTHMHQRLTLEGQLRRALERNEFVLHYQPQVNAASGRIIGLEALVRWQNPELGLVSPALFIPIAEETGLIVPIGAWVLHTACAQNRAWQDAGITPLRVAVNLSARQFRQQDVVRLVADTLAATGLDGRYLDIELTESMLMHDPEHINATLQRLKMLDVRIALDDFGTGYSSLAYLRRFPIDEIKIDKSFVQDLSNNAEDAAIVRAIMGIARNLGLSVVAEGVETVEQLHFLQNHDCDRIQGFLFSRPVPATAIPALLAASPKFEAGA